MAVEEGLGLTTISNPKLFALFVAKVEEGLGLTTISNEDFVARIIDSVEEGLGKKYERKY